MTTNHDLTLCLGKTPGGKPNGCPKSDTCGHHIEIKKMADGIDYAVKNRICGALDLDYYIEAGGK